MLDIETTDLPGVMSLFRLREALTAINNIHSRGSIDTIHRTYSRPLDGVIDGHFIRRVYYSQYGYALEKRKFRVRGMTVFALRHQRTVREVS